MIIQINNIRFWVYPNCGLEFIKKLIENNYDELNNFNKEKNILIIRNPIHRLLDYYRNNIKNNNLLNIRNEFNLVEGDTNKIFPINNKFISCSFKEFIETLYNLIYHYKYDIEYNLKPQKKLLEEDKIIHKYSNPFCHKLNYDSPTFEKDILNILNLNISNVKIQKKDKNESFNLKSISSNNNLMKMFRTLYKDDIILFRRLFDNPIEFF